MLDAARALRGWRVFPLRPGDKRPAFPDHNAARLHRRPTRGAAAGTRDGNRGPPPTRPASAGRGRTRAYNIGIATGPSGLVVIDLDKPKPGEVPPPHWALPGITDGADVLAALCERHGQPWPVETFMVRTGRGGLHLYFTAPPGIRLGNTSRPLGARARLADRHPRARRLRGRARLVRGPARRHRPL